MGFWVLNVQPFKGRHGAAAKQRGELAAPQVPQKVLPALPLRRALRRKIAQAGAQVTVIQQRAAPQGMALKRFGGKFALVRQGHRTVVQQAAVLNVVYAALGIQEGNVLLQLFAVAEGCHQLVQHKLFVGIQAGRVLWIYRGEVAVPQGIDLAKIIHRSGFVINAAQKIPPLHLEIRVAVDHFALQLQHQDGDGLVHDSTAVQHSVRVGAAGGVGVRHPNGQVLIAVILLRHAQQVAQIDAVKIFNHAVVVVGKGGFQHRAAAQRAASGGTHPHNVVVAPLEIHVVVGHQSVQDQVRAGAAVKQVTNNVQLVHRKALDQLTQADDESVRAVIGDNAAHDLAIVEGFVVVLKVGVQKLVNDMPTALRQAGTHIFPCVLGRNKAAYIDQAQQRLAVPGFQLKAFRVAGLEQGQLARRVVDQGGKLGTDGLGHVFTQDKVNFFADNTGSGVQQVDKSLIFAVQVTDIMLGTLGQLGGGFQADNGAGSRGLGGIIPCQQRKIL